MTRSDVVVGEPSKPVPNCQNALEDAALIRARVHDRVAHQHVHDAGDRIQTDVLGENLGRVFGTDEA